MENEALIQINPNIQTDVEIYWQDEVVVDLDMQLFYIKSGQNEVQQYVEGTIKPDIKSYTDKYAKPIVKETVDKIAKPQIDNYIASVVLNKIDDFTQEKLSVYATRSETLRLRQKQFLKMCKNLLITRVKMRNKPKLKPKMPKTTANWLKA